MKQIYRIKAGSHLYGTNTNESDIDIRGVLLPTIEECIGLRELNDIRNTDKDKNIETVMHPINKFLKLAMKCNPNILEWLFAPKECVELVELEFVAVLDNKNLFLSKEIFHRFKGYAWQEFSSLTKLTGKTGEKRKKQIRHFGYSPKNAMNVIRLLEQGIELLNEKCITLPRPNADKLLKIKNGELNYSEIVREFDSLINKIEKAYNKTDLPKDTDFEKINNMMIDIIMNQ